MKVLFVIRSVGYIRVYKSILRALSEKGAHIVAVFDPREFDAAALDYLKELALEIPLFSYRRGHRRSVWKRPLRFVRGILHYRRFLRVPQQSEFFVRHWRRYLPDTVRWAVTKFPFLDKVIASEIAGRVLSFFEQSAPLEPLIMKQITEIRPDIAVIAYRSQPSSSPDLDYLKVAKALGIPTVIPNPSWDSLSSRGLMIVAPDRVFVWNKEQVRETMEHHGIPESNITIVGAYQFDDWFRVNSSSLDRVAFCARYGLDPVRPILLYLGSGAATGDGPDMVREIREHLNNAEDAELRSIQILVRPSPLTVLTYTDLAARDTVVAPSKIFSMNDPDEVQMLFDSITHSFVAVTVHTTGIVDALIKSKPGIVIMRSNDSGVQRAQHFQHLLASGAVEAVPLGPQFLASLKKILAGGDPRKKEREAFIAESIRPRGLEWSVGEVVADEIWKLSLPEKGVQSGPF